MRSSSFTGFVSLCYIAVLCAKSLCKSCMSSKSFFLGCSWYDAVLCSPQACKWTRPFCFVSTSFRFFFFFNGYLKRGFHCNLQFQTRPLGSLSFIKSFSILLMFLFCFDIYVFWIVRTAGWEAIFPLGGIEGRGEKWTLGLK